MAASTPLPRRSQRTSALPVLTESAASPPPISRKTTTTPDDPFSSSSSAALAASLDAYPSVTAWLNDLLSPSPSTTNNTTSASSSTDLAEVDERVNSLLTRLEVAAAATASTLERTIADVSRTVPRLNYDLQFMRENASALRHSLRAVQLKAAPASSTSGAASASDEDPTTQALDRLRYLHTVQSHMTAAHAVLREAESWSTLEPEVSALIAESAHARAADRLAEAASSLGVFANTPEYDSRRSLLFSLQNGLEAALSSALVAAVQARDVDACKAYFGVFGRIEREEEFRGYWNGTRRGDVVELWAKELAQASVVDVLPTWFKALQNLLVEETDTVPLIFPDPLPTISAFLLSTIDALSPSFPTPLSELASSTGLADLIAAYEHTVAFVLFAHATTAKLLPPASPIASPISEHSPVSAGPTPSPAAQRSAKRLSRRLTSHRLSVSATDSRPNFLALPGTGGGLYGAPSAAPEEPWEVALLEPFLEFQTSYATLERRALDPQLRTIWDEPPRLLHPADGAKALRDKASRAFALADDALARCVIFTAGFALPALLSTLDSALSGFFARASATLDGHKPSSGAEGAGGAAADLDYTPEDLAVLQLSLRLLETCREVGDRLKRFEEAARSKVESVAKELHALEGGSGGSGGPGYFPPAPPKGRPRAALSLLQQSALNSLELQTLIATFDPAPAPPSPAATAVTPKLEHRRSDSRSVSSAAAQTPTTPSRPEHRRTESAFLPSPAPSASAPTPPSPAVPAQAPTPRLLPRTASALKTLTASTQQLLQRTILSPLLAHLAPYPSLPVWGASPPAARPGSIAVPTFSLSPTETIARVGEGLLNLPGLFESYVVDDRALAHSVETLPFVDALPLSQAGAEEEQLPAEMVLGTWLSSLTLTLLSHLTGTMLPALRAPLSEIGARQLASDLGYLGNVVRALDVEWDEMDKWREACEAGDARKWREGKDAGGGEVWERVGKLRGWN